MNDLQNAFSSANTKLEQFQRNLIAFGQDYGLKIIGAVIILLVGFFISRWVGNLLRKWLDKQQLEPPVKTLFVRVARLAIMLFTLLAAAEKVGLPVTTAIAGISVAGVGIGLATQGVLSNLVAGLVIIFTKPFRVGEYIHLVNVEGQVKNVELFSTTLLHGDLSRVVIPNRKIVGEILHNYGTIRQLDLSVGVSYRNNVQDVLALVQDILAKNPRVLQNPAPAVGVSMLGEFSIVIAVKPWANLADVGPAQVEIYQSILKHFQEKKIDIPFPQREVRVVSQAALQ